MREAISTGQWFTSGDGHEWWFDSGSIALDFAYTGGLGDNPAWERIAAASDLTAWLGDHFSGLDAEATDGDVRDGLMLRAAIANATNAASRSTDVAPTDIDVINLFAATPDIPPALGGGTRQAGRSRARTGQLLSTIARQAVDLFEPEQSDRIRLCAADDCGFIFFDESRSNNRRWCSMQRCGNRAKVRAHRARTVA